MTKISLNKESIYDMRRHTRYAYAAFTISHLIRLYFWPPIHVWDQKYFAPSHVPFTQVPLIERGLRRGKGGQRRVPMRLTKSPRSWPVNNTEGDEALRWACRRPQATRLERVDRRVVRKTAIISKACRARPQGGGRPK